MTEVKTEVKPDEKIKTLERKLETAEKIIEKYKKIMENQDHTLEHYKDIVNELRTCIYNTLLNMGFFGRKKMKLFIKQMYEVIDKFNEQVPEPAGAKTTEPSSANGSKKPEKEAKS